MESINIFYYYYSVITTSGIRVVGKSQNREAKNKSSKDSIKHKGNNKNPTLNAYRHDGVVFRRRSLFPEINNNDDESHLTTPLAHQISLHDIIIIIILYECMMSLAVCRFH